MKKKTNSLGILILDETPQCLILPKLGWNQVAKVTLEKPEFFSFLLVKYSLTCPHLNLCLHQMTSFSRWSCDRSEVQQGSHKPVWPCIPHHQCAAKKMNWTCFQGGCKWCLNWELGLHWNMSLERGALMGWGLSTFKRLKTLKSLRMHPSPKMTGETPRTSSQSSVDAIANI